MPPFGSAPHRVLPGVWVTRAGRHLTAEGNHYWETQLRLGATDGRGHYNHTVGRQIRQARTGATPAIRRQAGHALGEMAHRQQQTLLDAGTMARSFTPIGAAEAVVTGVKHHDPLGVGLGAMGLLPIGPLGRLGRASREALKAEKAAAKVAGPEEKVLGAMGAARRTRAEQKKVYSAERGRRVGEARSAFEAAGGGMAGHQAAKGALAGELPKLRFDRLTHLDDATMNRLTDFVHNTDLSFFEKTALTEALHRAREGQVPRMFEIKLIEKAFGPEKAAEAMSWRTKTLNAVGEVVNAPRAILASADVSAPFRQALLAGAANPRIFARNLAPMFHALVSEKKYQAIQKSIQDMPEFELMQESGVKFTGLGDLSHREEAFMSNFAEKITGGKYSFVRASGRAYTGFLNLMRAHMYAKLLDDARALGVETPKSRRDIARFVNVATGRGELGPLEGSAVALNTVFFAPRLFASRIQALNPVFYASLDPIVRKKAVASMAKLVGAGTTILTLAALAGAKVNTDPRNADFGKLRVGNTRFDIWGGHQQLARLFAQLASGQVVSSTTGKTLRLKGGYNLSRQDITKRFFEGKLAPTPSLINDWFKGTDFADKPFSWKREVVSRSYPLLIQDALDIYHGTGSPWKAIGGYGIGAFGVGVQTYGPPKPKAPAGGGQADPFASIFTGEDSSDPFGSLFTGG